MATRDATYRVDAYLETAQPFAQPILTHLRELVHRACPNVEEAMKWSMPFFLYRGAIMANMAAFKEHCSFGFWGREMGAVLREAGVVREDGMGSLGRIKDVKALPPNKVMLGFIRQAAAFIDNGEYTSPVTAMRRAAKPEKPALEVPAAFEAALRKNEKAARGFATFSPSCKREYVEWIADAKRPETQERRIATAIEWIAEGRQRNWKYQDC